VEAHRPADVAALKASFGAEATGLKSGRAQSRAYLRRTLRESGLLYGTPVSTAKAAAASRSPAAGATRSAAATRSVATTKAELLTSEPRRAELRRAEPPEDERAEDGRADERRQGPEEVLFLAVLRTFCRMSLDIAVLEDAAPGPRPEQALLLLAALGDRLDDAADIHRRIERAWRQWPLPAALWLRVEEVLEARALSLGADPSYGLVLHNGAVYADAYLFGRLAIAYFSGHTFRREVAERRLALAAAQKARLVEVLVGLTCAERKPAFPARRAILRQIDDLQLPAELLDSTREFARRAFDKPPSVKRLARGVKSQDLKRFILEQTVLASLVDGRRSPREVQWTYELAGEFGYTAEQMKQLEVSMADFYRTHRDVVDVFTLADGADVMGEEWVDELSTMVRKNSRAVLNEIRKTGELSVLLARAARGQGLSADEKRRMREQLLDVARAVPALALFAAPGGALVLLALTRVLPFKLLPSSFWDEDDEKPGEKTGKKPGERAGGSS
jgi:DnaJ-domain-containing protein 1